MEKIEQLIHAGANAFRLNMSHGEHEDHRALFSLVRETARRLNQHIAIIMDGNGRWAKQRGRPRTFGHQNGVKSVREASEAAAELGKGVDTLAFDATDHMAVRKAVDDFEAARGSIDILVNNAGISSWGQILSDDVSSSLADVLNVNVDTHDTTIHSRLNDCTP